MATTAFGSLAVPPVEDNMEISSPANRHYDEDTDIIDFDEYQDDGIQIEDSQMLEDGEQPLLDIPTDDIMDDGTAPAVIHHSPPTAEHVMEDSPPMEREVVHEQDEELLDYGDDNIVDQTGEDEAVLEASEPQQEVHIIDEADASNAAQDDNAEVVEDDALKAQPAEIVPAPSPPAEDDQLPPELDDEDQLPPELDEDGDDAGSPYAAAGEIENVEQVEDDTVSAAGASSHTAAATQLPAEESFDAAALTLDATTTEQINDGPDTPTDTGLHPMTVHYGDMHMPLFKSRHQPDGLLKDDNLASLSLAELMQNCRQRLGVKIGEEVSPDQEVELSFNQLGLTLVEDTRPAFESSLNDVLEVYLQLHHNDHMYDVPSLTLTLSLRLKFTSSFDTLKQAATGGQGMSSFAALSAIELDELEFHDGLDENATSYDNHVDEFNTYHEADDHYDETTYVEGFGNAEHDDGEPNPLAKPDKFSVDDNGDLTKPQQYQDDNQLRSSIGHKDHRPEVQSTDVYNEHEDGGDANPALDQSASVTHEHGEHAEARNGHITSIPQDIHKPDSTVSDQKPTDNAPKDELEYVFEPTDTTGDYTVDYSATLEITEDGGDVHGVDPSNRINDHAHPASQDSIRHTEHNRANSKTEDFEDYEEVDFADTNHNDAERPVDTLSSDVLHDHDQGQYDEQNNHTDTYHEQSGYEEHDSYTEDTTEQYHTAHDLLDEYDQNEIVSVDNQDQTRPANDPALDGDDAAGAEHPGTDDLIDPEEDFDNVDDLQPTYKDDLTPAKSAHATSSGSPLGKRSYEEHADDDVIDDGEPEVKKARPT